MRVCMILSTCLVWAAIGTASAAEAFRWALVPAAAPAAQSTADLLTVELSQWSDVQLVERSAIERVLAELKLNASGLVASDRAVEFGKLAAADVVVFVEALDKLQPPQNHVRAVETRTGVRLLDTLAPVKALAADVQALASELKLAKEKWRTPADKRHYLAVLSVRSEEPGHALQPLAAALTALLEHDLQQAPSIAVLEREQLRKLREEQQLTGADLELRSAVVLVEVGLRRNETGEGLTVNLSLLSLAGQPPRTQQFILPGLTTDAVRHELSRQVQQLLGEPKASLAASDTITEAGMFLQRSRWLGYHQPDEAISLAEAALALHPAPEHYSQVWQANFTVFRRDVAKLGIEVTRPTSPGDRRQAALDQLTSVLAIARRMHDLDLARVQTPDPRFGPLSLGVNGNPFEPHTPRIWAEPEPPELDRLRQEIDALRWEKYRLLLAARQARQESALELMLRRLELSHYFAATPEELCRQTLDWQKELDAEFARETAKAVEIRPRVRRYTPEQLSHKRGENVEALLIQRQVIGRRISSADDDPRVWPPEQLAPLWSELASHEHLGVRAVGLAGLTDLSGQQGRQALQDLVACLAQIPASQFLGFPPDALESLAIQRLTTAKLLNTEVERRLSHAEQQKDPRSLWNQRPKFARLALAAKREDYSRRAIKLVDEHPVSGQDQNAAADLRKSLVDNIRLVNIPLPADLRPQQPATGPWADYRLAPLRLAPPAGAGPLLGVTLDREALDERSGDELLVFWRTLSGQQEALVGRTGLGGSAMREVGRVPYEAFPSKHQAATGAGAIFVNIASFRAPGFAVLRTEKCQPFREADGFPGRQLLDLEWLDGGLYLSLGNGLARFDPERGTFRILASNLSVDGKGPLDGGSGYVILDLQSDPARHQLWLVVNSGARRSDQGIWRFTPATEKWDRVFAAPSNLHLSNLWWAGGRLRFIANFGWRELDPERGVVTDAAGYNPFPRGNMNRFASYYQQSGEHIVGLDGQLYAPDGQVSQYPSRSPWRGLVAVPQGFLIHDAQDGLLLLEHRSPP